MTSRRGNPGPTWRRRLWRPLLLVVVLTVAAACGVPTDKNPSSIDITPTPTSSRNVGSSAETSVFFVRSGHLQAVKRRIASADPVTQAVQALLNGVTDSEASAGLRSAITKGVTLHGVRRQGDQYVTVDLGAGLATVGGSEQALAVAQVVYTVTEVDGDLPVKILLDGAAVQVPRADGTLTGRPLTREDYRSVAPVTGARTSTPRATARTAGGRASPPPPGGSPAAPSTAAAG